MSSVQTSPVLQGCPGGEHWIFGSLLCIRSLFPHCPTPCKSRKLMYLIKVLCLNTIGTIQGAPWRIPCRTFPHRKPTRWQPSSSWDWCRCQSGTNDNEGLMLVLSENCWRWVLSDEDYPECRCDDLLCVLVEERLPVQVDIAACQAVPPCPHLKFPPDSRFQITMFKETDHNVSTTSGTIVLPANKKVFNFFQEFDTWQYARQG